MRDQQSLRSACAYAQSDQSLCLSLKYSMKVKLLTEHHHESLSLKEAAQARLNLHLSNYHIVRNLSFALEPPCMQSKLGCKDQEMIQSSTTPDPGYQWKSDKFTVRHHKQEPRGQSFPSR